jgi:bla regulator protein BlaR1
LLRVTFGVLSLDFRKRKKMPTFNRFYILGSVLFALLAPLYIIYLAPILFETNQTGLNFTPTKIKPSEVLIEKSINYTQILISIYVLISAILFIRFAKNLFHILLKTRKNPKVQYQNAHFVLVADKILPLTFWNYLFINKNDYENQKIEQEPFTH